MQQPMFTPPLPEKKSHKVLYGVLAVVFLVAVLVSLWAGWLWYVDISVLDQQEILDSLSAPATQSATLSPSEAASLSAPDTVATSSENSSDAALKALTAPSQ